MSRDRTNIFPALSPICSFSLEKKIREEKQGREKGNTQALYVSVLAEVVLLCVCMCVRVVAPKRQVYTVDMRNHGQSPHVSEMDLHSLSRDVTKFMDTEGEMHPAVET